MGLSFSTANGTSNVVTERMRSISYARTGNVVAKFHNATSSPVTISSRPYNITVVQ